MTFWTTGNFIVKQHCKFKFSNFSKTCTNSQKKVKKKLDFLGSRRFCGHCKKFSYTKLAKNLSTTFLDNGYFHFETTTELLQLEGFENVHNLCFSTFLWS